MRKLVVAVIGFGFVIRAWGATSSTSASFVINTTHDNLETQDRVELYYSPSWLDGYQATISLDGKYLFSSDADCKFVWQPHTLGKHVLTYSVGDKSWSVDYNVKGLTFDCQQEPNPPMARDDSIGIGQSTRSIPVGGATLAITVRAINESGNGKVWTAATSVDWIELPAKTGTCPDSVMYKVHANTGVEQRIGYIYVSGHVYTVTQAGNGATINPQRAEIESDGSASSPLSVTVDAMSGMSWHAYPNDDWLSVDPAQGIGSGQVNVFVAPCDEVQVREGTLTIAGNTFTVYQTGRRMRIDATAETCDYHVHNIPIQVEAFANTSWGVIPDASWLSVLDPVSGVGVGSRSVTISVGENLSYLNRTSAVLIGDETLTVIQKGRTDCSLEIDPNEPSYAAVGGADGHIGVRATPDLPWAASSDSNWLVVRPDCYGGAGNGNIYYTVMPNPTLYSRKGVILVRPDEASGVEPKRLVVTQPAAKSLVAPMECEFQAAGEPKTIEVSVDKIVVWTIRNTNEWIQVNGELSRMGSGSVVLQANPNNSVYSRMGSVSIADQDVRIVQKGHKVEIECEGEPIFDTDGFAIDGASEPMISVHPDGNISWGAVSSVPWIMIYPGYASGVGDGSVVYVVEPWENYQGESRTGTITIGDEIVYITQRGYNISVQPTSNVVEGNAGAGDIGIAADIGSVWEAIATVDWIKVITITNPGTGSGTVHYTFTDNDTGRQRSGKIIISGEEYTLTQRAREFFTISTSASFGGTVEGAGRYARGENVVLTPIPNDGYAFAYWEGDVSQGQALQNPLKMCVEGTKSVRAVFNPKYPEFISVESGTDGVRLTWTGMAWASQYKIHRAPSGEIEKDALVTLDADGSCSYLDQSGIVGKTYWYWVEAIGEHEGEDTECERPVSGKREKTIVRQPISYVNLKGARHSNPSVYIEGDSLVFASPGGVLGYTFAGWTPSGITADTTGPVTATAKWTANSYSVAYSANGGVGPTKVYSATYDRTFKLIENPFLRKGYSFVGWGMEPTSVETFGEMEEVSNLSAAQGGVVSLYAIWRPNQYRVRFNANGGTGTMGDQSLSYGSAVRLLGNVFYWTGMEFAGWARTPEGEVCFKDGELVTNLTEDDGEVIELYAKWSKIEVERPQIKTGSGSLKFFGEDTVEITCATKDALVYYSTTGEEPRIEGSCLYNEPFIVSNTVVVKAVAVKNGVKSACATVMLEKMTMSLGTAIGVGDMMVVSGGDASWQPTFGSADVTDGFSARSGRLSALGGNAVSWMELQVDGPGELTFSWRISGENGGFGVCSGARLMCCTDGASESDVRIDGMTDWLRRSIVFADFGKHTVRWLYSKPAQGQAGAFDDGFGWVDCVVWNPGVVIQLAETGGVSLHVKQDWALQYPRFKSMFGKNLVDALGMNTGKFSIDGMPIKVWQEYVAGTDPTDVADVFEARIEMVDGLPKVSWRPDLNQSEVARTYKVYGRRSLASADGWEHPANAAEHRFFKVSVAMPEAGDGGSDEPGTIEAWRFVDMPTAVGGLVYDGLPKQGVLPGSGYSLAGASAIDADDYLAQVVLAEGWKWSNGDVGTLQIPWQIAKAENGWVKEPGLSSEEFFVGSPGVISNGVPKFGVVRANYSQADLANLPEGSYSLTFTVDGTSNYSGLNKTVNFAVRRSPAADVGLLHRWSFDGDLIDSVGGVKASAPASVGLGNGVATVSSESYIDLGNGLIPADGKPFTLEVWATQDGEKVKNERVFSLSTNVWGVVSECFNWLWDNEYNRYQRKVSAWNEAYVGEGRIVGATHHFAVVGEPKDNAYSLTFYLDGKVEWTKTASSSWKTAPMLRLGYRVNGNFDEVRIWAKAFSSAEVVASCSEGPNGNLFKADTPVANDDLVYSGQPLVGVKGGAGYTLTGERAVNVGTYTATATLKSGYEWSDGVSSRSRAIAWSIAKASNSWLADPGLSSAEFEEGSAVTVSVGSAKFGVCQSNYTAAELAKLAAGSYTLVVSVAGTDNYTGLTKSIPFVVTGTAKPVSGVNVFPTSLTLNGKGEKVQLVATVLPSTALNKAVTWTTSNPAVVTVDAGVVTAVGLGVATVTATTQEGGFSKSCSVTVASVCVADGKNSDMSNVKLYSGSSYPKSGNGAWYEQGSQVYSGGKALRSGNRDSRSFDSYLGAIVYGSGTITFWWKVSSSSADKLRFYVESDYKAEISGTGSGWQQVSLRLEEAHAHRIRWVYNNYDSSVDKSGEDCGWVDCVQWLPDLSTSNPPTRIEISGSDSVTPRTSNKSYVGKLYFQSGAESSMSSYNQVMFGVCAILPIWSIDETNTGVTINPYSGELVLNGYTGMVTVRATYTANGVSVTGTKVVSIAP